MCVASKYKLEFTDQQREEIEAMWFEGFEPDPTEPQSRSVWMAIGHIALGKAQRIETGDYGEPEDDMEDNEEWSGTLREIADVIFNEFRPGDMKI